MTTQIISPDKRKIAARFDRAAEFYDSGAVAQGEITRRLADLIKDNIRAGQLWCDIGSATGTLAEHLAPLPERTTFICLDIANSLLRRAARRGGNVFALNGDIEFPPIRPKSLDGAAAASMLQWVSSPQLALRKIFELLKPDGILYFAVFVEGAFEEINSVRSKRGLPQAVWLPSESELFLTLESAGFDIVRESAQQFNKVLQFADAVSALKSLSKTGASATDGKLLNRRELDELCGDYTSMFSQNGTVSLTYRSLTGMARKSG